MKKHDLNSVARQIAETYCRTGKYLKAEQSVLHTMKYRDSERGGAILLGESGIGKTTFAKTFLSQHAEASLSEHDNKFGIYVEVPGGNLKVLYGQILQELGDIAPEKGTAADKKTRIIKLINEMDVKVVFVDEVQEVLPSTKLLPTSAFVKDFKEIANNTNCAWILCGTPNAMAIKDVDKQLASRLPKTILLPVFSFKTQEDKLEYLEFLFEFFEHLPVAAPYFKCLNESITDEGFSYFCNVNYDNLLRMLLATDGCLRPFMTLMQDCLDRLEDGEKITKSTLVEAYDECFEGEELNPFSASISKVKKLLIQRGLYA
ncbi:TniB family NTP-binding protein [Thalassotalea ponticola]|uniref:TniB family NTP-binding protein n=1 Tax=Thalassotalea ponticola TaxID=1523392 RepID=UPI0025B35EB0|nr:TniB family NTP-binding protein [Thalassotalea ponticola]MDN3653430.1 TniB family NTP-binding protein [Thalassotalea ponticola]